MTFAIQRYLPELSSEWDAFVAASRNGTFLLQRGYMDYHQHRFNDHSLMMRDSEGRLVAVLPAHRIDDVLHSHSGLSYGGLILGARGGVSDTLALFDALRAHMRDIGLRRLHYKTIPAIYHRQPAEDDRYALFRAQATLTRRDVLSVVPAQDRIRLQERRSRGARSARKAGVLVGESADFAPFWRVLNENLLARYGVPPVHSLDEIRLLGARFPQSIRLFTASQAGALVAGTVIYETPRVAHVQYISANDEGRKLHALDHLFDSLLTVTFASKPFFDFGTSTEQGGTVLNTGLAEQKEGFGARTVVHDHYELTA